MTMARWRRFLALVTVPLLVMGLLALSVSPTSAQNRRKSWEIFIYFGEYGGQKVPSAIQSGVIKTYRLDPVLAVSDPNGNPLCTICRNAGDTGPGSQFLIPNPQDPFLIPDPVDVCFDSTGSPLPVALDPNSSVYDECDDDIEAVYKYNRNGIVTNGAVERNDSEFLLGARFGYNITNHWEVEFDLGFAKQRLDMTRNLIPLLQDTVSNPADPLFQQSAEFFEFTWANRDFLALGYLPSFDPSNPGTVLAVGGMQEIPNVPHRRFSKNPGADIPAVLPMPLVASEKFEDVTDFVNRVFLDPTAFRNRANQINIDIFTLGLTGVYNFNTKPDSRVVPYLSGGFGKWIRQFDTPYDGEDTDYLTLGGGARFFINEIFSFRAELRQVMFQDDEMTITGKLPKQNLVDFTFKAFGCVRDQDPPAQQPPLECSDAYLTAFNTGTLPNGDPFPFFPSNVGAGGFATVEFITETDDFWEARVGFDVLLGGR